MPSSVPILSAIAMSILALALFMPSSGSMFERFPRVGKTTLPIHGDVDLPYHNYDSDALLVHGWADADGVRSLIANDAFHPVINRANGKAIGSFWVVNYKNTSVNPYKELLFTFAVATKPTTVDCGSIHCVNVVNTQPGVYQYIYKLWLDQTLPIEYGRHLLGCDKYTAEIKIERAGNRMEFDFTDSSEHEWGNLMSGSLNLNTDVVTGYLAHLPSLIYEMGLIKATFFVLNPPEFIRWDATGPPGVAVGAAPAVPLTGSPLWGALFVTAPRFTWFKGTDQLKFGSHWDIVKFEPLLYQFDGHLQAILLGAWGHAAAP
eukprot:TRINITY_DN363_c0_g1_i4.p1 TRINITY_DN363_c0_g1~~TRINITY_DN363_c0_g1_i4.p1  ORF type:complete len:318 (-),score=55.90 TRINITY_DN363_c0_g1_i4:102-1055(-)